jgi:signal transduction histidine kinase
MGEAGAKSLQGAIDNAWLIFAFSVVLNCLLAAGFGIYVSHRFLGPSLAIQGLVRELKEGNFKARKNLRKGDELMSLMEEVNGLAETLEKKYGSSNSD